MNEEKNRIKTEISKSIERDCIKSRTSVNRKNPSPLDDLPDSYKYKPITNISPIKPIKENNSSMSKVMSPTNKTSKGSEHTKWIKLQERINALKS